MRISRGRRALLGYCIAFAMAFFMIVPAGPAMAEDTTVLLQHFSYGNTNHTLNLTAYTEHNPTELLIDIPRGAAIISANVSVRGIEGTSLGYTMMDFSNHDIGDDLWALHNEDTGLYPLSVDPTNNTWDAIPSAQVDNISSLDGDHWHTKTPSDPSTTPWEYPVQLFHFQVDVDDAVSYEVRWKGRGQCLGNTTGVLNTSAWAYIYNHEQEEWDSEGGAGSYEGVDYWLNKTASVPLGQVSANGSVDFAIMGPPSEVNDSAHPSISDYGHIWTDYINITATHKNVTMEYPEDVTLRAFGPVDILVKDGQLNGTVVVGEDDDGLKDAFQAHIDHYPQQPGNVTIDIGVIVDRLTYAKVEIFDLNILYDSTGVIPNDPPEWAGPSSVDVKEDLGWRPVLDLDQAFTDDYDEGDLQFSIVDVSHTGALETRLREGLLDHHYLEVKPKDNFYGDVEVIVSASDSGGLSTESPPITVHVEQVPDAPWLLEPGVITVNESERVNLTLVVLDHDMPDDGFTFSDTSDMFDIDPGTGTIDWTPTADDIGIHTCTATVEDSYGLTDRITIVIEVLDVNHPPMITSAKSIQALEGQKVVYTITAEDEDAPQGDTLTFSAWSVDVEVLVDALTGRVSLTPEKGRIGQILVFIKVEDSFGVSTTATVSVDVGNINDPPTLEDIGHLTYLEGATVTVSLMFDDPDIYLALDEPEVLTISSEGPEFLHADKFGFVNLTIDQSMVGEHLVTYSVTDREGLSASIEVLWTLKNVNDDPVITTEVPASVEATEDSLFTLALDATDHDDDTLTWSDSSSLFDIDPVSGTISFTPVQADVGTHAVTVTVRDGNEGLASITFDLVVENVNDAPVIVTVQPSDGAQFKEGKLVRLSVEATDEDGDALSYFWKEGGTEIGAGSPMDVKDLAPGAHTITLVVTDGAEETVRTFEVYIEAAEAPDDEDGMKLIRLVMLLLAIITGILTLYLLRMGKKQPEIPLM